MRARDDLVVAFCRAMPARVAEATELWLAFEEGRSDSLAVLRRLLHTIKGEAQMLELALCGELAEVAESLVEALRKAGGQPTPLTGDALLGGFEGMGLITASVASDEPVDLEVLFGQLRSAIAELEHAAGARPPSPSPPPPRRAESARPSAFPIPEELASLKAEDVRPLVHEMRRLYGEQAVFHQRLRETQRMLRALLSEIDPRQSPATLLERVTKTLNYGAEIDRRMSTVRTEWSSNDFSMGLVLDELDAAVRRASVVSTDRLLNQVKRIGRSTARTLGKDVELRVRGDAMLDASVEQRLEPALLHLLRNAIDHGIEPVELRRTAGKPERGNVSVSVSQNGSSVTVEVSDDGAGIDFDRLRRVIAPRIANVDALTDDELVPFLFEQGITTSGQVTSISGRGVGLDVVAREVAAAAGQIRVESNRDLGTRFLLQLPATLRGELAVPVVSGEQRYAVPSRAVSSVIRIESIERTLDGLWTRVQNESSSQLVRLFSLDALLGQNSEPKIGQAALVLYHAAGLYAVSVEHYDNPRAISVTRSEELAFQSSLVRGVAATPDGNVLLLLDVDALHSSTRSVALGRPNAVPEARQPCALVVEDAPVARELLCGILRSLGLNVEEATNGRQGLMLAQSVRPDVVLTDLEMPYMDGIDMISEFRRTPSLARVPVIVLTTAGTEQNLARLAQLGVTAVLSKQRFVESELRELIDRCVNVV
jgi:two-component system, chemotaxis family, sensor kinase CheA